MLDGWRAVRGDLIGSAALVAVGTLAAKMAGFVKELATASRLGVSEELDAFVLAFAIPATLVALVAGPLATAFVPAFVAARSRGGDTRAGELLDGALFLGAGFATLVGLASIALANPLLGAIGGGAQGARLDAACRLLSCLVPMVVLQVPAALWSAVLNSSGRFGVPAIAPAAMPVCAAIGLVLAPSGASAVGLAIGFSFGSVVQLGLLAPGIASLGWLRIPRWPSAWFEIRHLWAQFAPLGVGALVLSGMPIVDQVFAARLPTGSLSTLAYAEKLTALVNGVFSMSLATVVLPLLARGLAAGDRAGAWRLLRRGVIGVAVVSVPLTLVLWVTSHEIARLIFQRGALDVAAAQAVGDVQRLSVLQIPFFAVGMLLSRYLSAAHRADLLLVGNVVLLIVNLVLDAVLVRWLGVAGIALATSIVYALAAVMLAGLCRYVGRLEVVGGGVLARPA